MVTDLAHTGVGTFSWPPVGTLNWPLTLGKILQLETIAEGIEDDDQRTCLQAEKVDVGQGFFFSRPLDADAIDKFLEGFTTTNPVKRANMTAST